MIPLRTAAEAVDKITRALVGARRMLDVLGVEREIDEPASPAPEPPPDVALVDPHSRARRRAGPAHGARLVTAGRDDARSRTGSAASEEPTASCSATSRIADLPTEVLRRRIVVSEADPVLFSGRLRGELDPWKRATDEEILDAVSVANAEDVLDALPERLDALIDERGRSFSGGQRQRLVLVRALLSQAETLVLVEPTSAVDAHTEARIARRLHHERAGKTTVVVTTSPLLLDQADRVVYVEDDRVVAEGAHRELLRDNADYRETVTRGEDE